MPGHVLRDVPRLASAVAVAASALLCNPPAPAAVAAVDLESHASFHRSSAVRALGLVVEDDPVIGCAAPDNPKYPAQITYDYDDPSQFSRVVLFTTLPPMQIGARVLILEYLDRPSLRQRALLTIVVAGSIPRASDVLFVLNHLKMLLGEVAAEHARTFRLFFDRTILLTDMRVVVEVRAGTPGKLHLAVVRNDFGEGTPCGINEGWGPAPR